MLNKKPYKKDLNVAATTPFDRMKLLFGFSPGRTEKKYLAWDFFLKIKTSDLILGQPMAYRHLDFFHFSYILGSDNLCALIICNDHYRQKKPRMVVYQKDSW